MILSYVLPFLYQMSEFDEKNKELKERAINEYNAALLMPRKKKKKAKKSALSLYSIACYGEVLFKFN